MGYSLGGNGWYGRYPIGIAAEKQPPLTVAFHFKATGSLSGGTAVIFSLYEVSTGSPDGTSGLAISVSATGVALSYVDNTLVAQHTFWAPSATVADGNWHAIVVAFAGSAGPLDPCVVYVDGVDIGGSWTEGTGTVPVAYTDHLGTHISSVGANWRYDQLAWFNTTKNLAWVQANYRGDGTHNERYSGFSDTTGLHSCWEFDDALNLFRTDSHGSFDLMWTGGPPTSYADEPIYTGSDATPPTAPTNLAATDITSTTFTLSWDASTDNVGVAGYRVYKDGVLYVDVATTSTPVSGLSPATTYSMTVKAYDAAGNLSAASTVLPVTTTGDTQDPTVVITSPLTGATVSASSVAFVATILDNVGIATAKLYVQGQLQQTLTAADAVGDVYTFSWATGGWANGTYVVEVVATDPTGNIGSDFISVDLQRSLANLTLQWITRQLPLTDTNWQLVGKTVRKFIETFRALYVDPDEGNNYLVQPLIHVPGNTTDLSQYQVIERYKTFQVGGTGNTFRLAWLATPFYVDATFATNSLTGRYPVPYTDANGVARLGFWGDSEDRLYSFEGLTVATLADLDADLGGYTINGLAYADGYWWVAVESVALNAVYRVDVDLGGADVQYWVRTPAGSRIACLATQDTYLLIGADHGDGTGAVYQFLDGVLELVGTIDSVSALHAYSGGVLTGTDSGKVYWHQTGAPNLLYDTGAVPIALLYEQSGVFYAAAANKLYSTRTNSWALETTFAGEGTMTGLVTYRDRLWASFSASANLWRYDEGSGWLLAQVIPDTTAVGGLVVYQDALIALKTDGVDAKLWRREVGVQTQGQVVARYFGDIGVELLEVLNG